VSGAKGRPKEPSAHENNTTYGGGGTTGKSGSEAGSLLDLLTGAAGYAKHWLIV